MRRRAYLLSRLQNTNSREDLRESGQEIRQRIHLFAGFPRVQDSTSHTCQVKYPRAPA